MRDTIQDRVIPLAALLGACAVVPAALIHFMGQDEVQIASGVQLTVVVTALSLTFGALLALPLAAARRASSGAVRLVATAYLDVVRAVPPITWLFLIYFGLPQYALRLRGRCQADPLRTPASRFPRRNASAIAFGTSA